MTIAIVTALPKSTPPPATNALEADDAGLAQDFTSLLFGQMTAAPVGAGLILNTASGAAVNDAKGWRLDDWADTGDPMELLAALTQAPLEQRGQLALAEDGTPAGLAGMMTRESPTDRRYPLADGMTQNVSQARLAANGLLAASGAAAKFAVLPNAMSGENAATSQESTGFATIAAGVPARRDAASQAIPIPVPTPLHDQNWGNDFAQKVSWVATHRNQSAELTLNPPAMGNIEISLKFDNDKSTATATFVSSNAEVRETIETALPRLREMLAGVGIQLGQTNVSAESFRQASGNGQNPGQGASQSADELAILASDPRADRSAAPAIGAGRGLIDMFV
jgi:flagellar hook-length control protein FliK